MQIRIATFDDFLILYNIGKNTPELRVSATEEFMDAEEFKWSLTDPNGVFLVAEETNEEKNKKESKKNIIGFVYAHTQDMERPYPHKYACLVYLVVLPEFRRRAQVCVDG